MGIGTACESCGGYSASPPKTLPLPPTILLPSSMPGASESPPPMLPGALTSLTLAPTQASRPPTLPHGAAAAPGDPERPCLMILYSCPHLIRLSCMAMKLLVRTTTTAKPRPQCDSFLASAVRQDSGHGLSSPGRPPTFDIVDSTCSNAQNMLLSLPQEIPQPVSVTQFQPQSA